MTNVYVVLSYFHFKDEDDSYIKAIFSSEEKALQAMDPDSFDMVEQWELDSQAEDARQTIY